MLADTTTTIAWVILLISVLGWIIYGLGNLRSSKREIGAEIKLAANRKPYYDDERLEGEKIQRTQLIGLACLAVTTIALPLYWILEPVGWSVPKKSFNISLKLGAAGYSQQLPMVATTVQAAMAA